jgi:outer membrane protein TolC
VTADSAKRMPRCNLLVWAAMLLMCGASVGNRAPAAELTSGPLDLEQCIALALDNNPRVKLVQAQITEAEQKLQEYKYAYGPVLGVDFYAAPGIGPEDQRNIGDRLSDDTLRFSVGIEAPLFVRHYIQNAYIARTECEIAALKEDLKEMQNQVCSEVMKAYWEVLETREMALVQKQIVEESHAREHIWKQQREQDYTIVERELLGELFSETEFEDLLYWQGKSALAQARLCSLTSLSTETQLVLVARDGYVVNDRELNLPDMVALAKANRPILARAEHQIARNAQDVRIGQYQDREVSIGLRYGLDYNWDIDDYSNFVTLGLHFKMPLRKRGLSRARVAQAEARMEQAAFDQQNRLNIVSDEVASAHLDFARARKRIETTSRKLRWTLEFYKNALLYSSVGAPSLKRFETFDRLEPFVRKIELLKARMEHLEAAYSLDIARSELYRTMGLAEKLPSIYQRKTPLQALQPEPQSTALWVWQSKPLLIDKRARIQFLDFCTSRTISDVMLYIGTENQRSYCSQYRAELINFLLGCSTRGIRVRALYGEPEWINPEMRKRVNQLLDELIEYNTSVEPEFRFAGAEFDIEFHSLPAWIESHDPRLVRQYLELMEGVIAKLRSLPEFTVAVDIPYTYESITVPDTKVPMSEYLTDRFDAITLMDYLVDTEALVAKAEPFLEYATERMKKIKIGLDTNGNAPSGTTFFPLPVERFVEITHFLRQSCTRYPVFDGLAIHDYTNFRRYLDSAAKKKVE